MSAPRLQALLSPLNTEPYRQRTDEASRNIVNQGIQVQSSFNTVCAIEYLKSHNVEAGIIERVLLHPERRRKSPR